MANKWTMFVREWSSKNNMSYGCAMTKQECKDAYKKENPTPSKSTNRRKKIAKEENKSVSEVVREEVDNSKIVDLEEAIPTPTKLSIDRQTPTKLSIDRPKVSSKRKYKEIKYQGKKYAYDKETKEVITREDFDKKNYDNTLGEYNEEEKEIYWYDDVPKDYTGEGLSNACWKGYEAIGMKKKGKKLVPNCVPMKDEGFNIITLKDGRRGIMKDNKFIEIMRGKGATASLLETNSYRNYMRLRTMLDSFITELENNTNRNRDQTDLLRELRRLKNQTRLLDNSRSIYSDADLDERALHIQFALENMELIPIPVAETNNIIEAQVIEPIFDIEGNEINSDEIRDVEGVGIHKTENYYIQSVVFEKNMFDLKEARKWLKENNYVSKKPDITDTQIRFRQVNPKYIENKGFDRFRTKKLGKKSGISLIIAYKNEMKGESIPPNNERGRRRMPIVNVPRVREDRLRAANIRDLNDRLEEILDYIESSDYENIYYNTTPTTELEGRLVNASYRLINNVTIFLNTLDDYQNNPVNNYTRMFRMMLRINEDIDRYENIRNEYLN